MSDRSGDASMMSKRQVLLALSDDEIDDFLAEPVRREMLALCPNHRRVDTAGLTPEQYADELTAYRPEIVVSAWSTPALLESRLPEILEFLRYDCHLTGTIRRFIPKAYLEAGLLVSNWGSSISDSVAECALLLILSALRRATAWALGMHLEGMWKPGNYFENYSLFGRRVGIHGFGAIARELVHLLRPFAVPISTYSPSVPDEILTEYGVDRAVHLRDLFDWSQVLVELAPLKPENRHIVDRDLLQRLEPGSVFVNVGRGACVDQQALIEMAVAGHVQIGLDVYEEEPLPVDSPLRGLRNVTLLPHIGGPTRDRRIESGKLALANLKRYAGGKTLVAQVSRDSYDRIT
jgi:phosphoglycerate dehydrogenase-like enzyme